MSSTTTRTASTQPAEKDRLHSRRWWILALVAVAQLMVVLDATIVNIALPSAQKALHFSDSDRQWIVTAYTLASGACCWSEAGLATSSAASQPWSPA
jgi:MFS family permease